MASANEHRESSRVTCRIPLGVECIACRQSECFDAMIYNITEKGFYLETDHLLVQGDSIHIHAVRNVPEITVCNAIRDNTGLIRWARHMKHGPYRYGAGAAFSYPDPARGYVVRTKSLYFCDVCGGRIHKREIRSDHGVWMCPHCSREIEDLPGKLLDTTERFLTGNAL